jgi:hypothetical protein
MLDKSAGIRLLITLPALPQSVGELIASKGLVTPFTEESSLPKKSKFSDIVK